MSSWSCVAASLTSLPTWTIALFACASACTQFESGFGVVAEVMFSDFFATGRDMVVNQIAKMQCVTNGQLALPLVIRSANGGGLRMGAQHSQSIESWAMAVPGKVVMPSSPVDGSPV
jgi:pyruvate/2-oxoglutarate/acetoin dehydrogenase E1 component